MRFGWAGHLFQNIQVLPGHDFGAHEVEDSTGAALRPGTNAGEHLLAEGQAQVPGQDASGLAKTLCIQRPTGIGMQGAELAVHAGTATARVRSVDDVIVDEGRGLEQFEGGACLDDRGVVGSAPGSTPAPVAKQSPHPLPTGDQGLDGINKNKGCR